MYVFVCRLPAGCAYQETRKAKEDYLGYSFSYRKTTQKSKLWITDRNEDLTMFPQSSEDHSFAR